jgi:hypothetical protein
MRRSIAINDGLEAGQLIQGDAQGSRYAGGDQERGLGVAGFVAADLAAPDTGGFGELGLGEAEGLPLSAHDLRGRHAGIVKD